MDAAMQRIAAESVGAVVSHVTSAPSRAPADASPSERSSEHPSGVPPDGYTFVRGFTFGWMRLAPGTRTGDVRQVLEVLGAEILGASAELVRARLPADRKRLKAILDLPGVDGLGTPPMEVKLAGMLADAMATAPPSGEIPVFINLMIDDPDGAWKRKLEGLGATVGRFDADIRAYAANVAYGVLQEIAAADFVLSVEPVGFVRASLDTAVPAMGADALRTYRGRDGLFSGIDGRPVPIGVMDTGLNTGHVDIASRRGSICGANFVSHFPRQEDQDLWVDRFGHGTHVTGIIAGNGFVDARYAGMAPGVQHIRFAKVLNVYGFGDDTTVLPGMDFLARSTACPGSGWSGASRRPLIVNMSLSGNSLRFDGRGANERKLDAVVWRHRQLYVVAQSNGGLGGFSDYGAAKNSLAVGAAMDRGDIAGFSSRGPTADGRLAPLVVGTGVRLRSARGNGRTGGYVWLNGTSMASPSVAGVAALLLQAAPEHRWKPALVRARLMASSIKPDFWMEGGDAFPLTNTDGPGRLQAAYGLGKVSARASILERDKEDGWVSGGAVSTLADGEYGYRDIVVPEGASRLDLVMTWDEPPADAIAGSVLNDLDLWLDQGADCAAAACGEHASRSRRDNVEWVIVRNPEPGTLRAKAVAHRVFGRAPRAALAWTVIRGPSTPRLTVTADEEDVIVGDGAAEITVTVAVDGYVAAGTELFIDCREGDAESTACNNLTLQDGEVSRKDGIATSWVASVGGTVSLGEISPEAPRTLTFSVMHAGSDSVRLYFSASAWNGEGGRTSVAVRNSATDAAVAEVASPPNDAFENAIELNGASGARESELLGATAQPSEPARTIRGNSTGRPIGSVWYTWTAPDDGLARFSVLPGKSSGQDIYVEVFRDESLASLELVAVNDWGVAFFAEAQQRYFVRLSNAGKTVPHTLQWARGRPDNDDFGDAMRLEGTNGSVEGSNLGASTQAGEDFRGLASTTWYRWTAPADGDWQFRSGSYELVVLAFTGNKLDRLRLVSGGPSATATFPVKQGREYRIAVVVRNTYESGRQSFELSWEETNRPGGNDDFAHAENLGSDVSSAWYVAVDNVATVEPDEPVETGVRTRWWAWTAPEDGRFTWRLEVFGLVETPQLTAFTGAAIDELEPAGASRPELLSLLEFVISANAGTRYSMALGLPSSGHTSLTSNPPGGTLRWGPTPGNDNVAGAVSLPGASGSVTGSNRFATSEPGERIGILGHSSLWWSFRALEQGWYRFRTQERSSMVLAVYRLNANGGLEFIRSGEPADFSGSGELRFEAEAGVDYRIRLGSLGSGGDGSFELQWEPAEAPMWLEYLGRVTSDAPDSNDMPIDLRSPGTMAFNSDGSALYTGSGSGLLVFERDPASGGIGLVQTLPANDHVQHGAMVWRERNAKLYARWCSNWRAYRLMADDSVKLVDDGIITVANQPTGYCHGKLLLDPEGSYVYFVGLNFGASRIEAYAFNQDGTLRFVESVDISNASDAVMSNSGNHLYAGTPNAIRVYRRNTESGALSESGTAFIGDARPSLAISDDDRYLFVVDDRGDTTILELEPDPVNPVRGHTLPSFLFADSFLWGCRAAGASRGNRGVLAFCRSSAFVVERLESGGFLTAADFVSAGGFDRFNNLVPLFTLSVVAASPDGRHAYVGATDPDQVQVYERVGNEARPAKSKSPDSDGVSNMLAVSDGSLRFGPIATSTCIALDDTEVDGARYTVESAGWQRREGYGGAWTEIDQTQTAGHLCAHSPSGPGEFRLVAELLRDGVRERHASNAIRR